MIKEERVFQMPGTLKLATLAFVFIWALIAIFPIFWILVMSFKKPLDAFSSNPLQVIFGFRTLKEVGGIALTDIIVYAFSLLGILGATKYGSLVIVPKCVEKAGNFFGWVFYSLCYLTVLEILLWFVIPAIASGVRSGFSVIPVLKILANPLIGGTTENYYAVWVERSFYQNFVNSMIITGGVILLSLTIGTLAGYALSRRTGSMAFFLLILALIFRALPHSVLVSGYLPIFINSKEILTPLWESSATGWFFQLFGESAPSLYGQRLPVIIVLVAINQPFTIWMLRSFFANIPNELDEAARVDGCNHFQAFRLIIMPVMWPGIITTGLFSFLLAYNDYLVTSLLLDFKAQTMVPAITQYFNRETTATDQIEAVAAAVSIVVPLFFLVMVFQKQIVSGLTQGAVKG